jgi:hypothetical protein
MGDGAQPVDFGRQDKIGAQQRPRHLGKVEIELNSRANEERAGQKLAKLAAAPCKIKCRQPTTTIAMRARVNRVMASVP